MFLVEYRRELRCPREGVFEAARDENYFRPVSSRLISKAKRNGNEEDRRTNIKNCIAADVPASWKKVKCRGLVFNGHGFHTP